MTIKDKLVKDLMEDEGFVPHAYEDSLKFLTIGYGRLIDKRKGGGITKEEAQYLLANDVDETMEELNAALPWLSRCPEHVRLALYNMAFQLGVGGLMKFKNTLALVSAGKYEAAADNALKSLWAEQTPNRAKKVTNLLRGKTT